MGAWAARTRGHSLTERGSGWAAKPLRNDLQGLRWPVRDAAHAEILVDDINEARPGALQNVVNTDVPVERGSCEDPGPFGVPLQHGRARGLVDQRILYSNWRDFIANRDSAGNAPADRSSSLKTEGAQQQK